MRTPTVGELRRVLGALVAAPLGIGCGSPVPPAPPPLRPEPLTPALDAAPIAFEDPPDAEPAPDAQPPKAVCDHGDPGEQTCGGAEVKLLDPPSVCGLPVDVELSDHLCSIYCDGYDWEDCRVVDEYYRGWIVACGAAHPCYGRLPSDGVMPDGPDALARARRLEAESVIAFLELADDLARWDAPPALVRACRRAARDEARHAALFARLLRARGVTPERLRPRRAPGFASLAALALHNEREGVVGETWGAFCAMRDAVHAPDADVRVAMRAIADDELGHAVLSFRIAAWARARLGHHSSTAQSSALPTASPVRVPSLVTVADHRSAGRSVFDRLPW